jgi:hypothetical protein
MWIIHWFRLKAPHNIGIERALGALCSLAGLALTSEKC